MKTYKNEENQRNLEKIKVEIANLKKGQKPKQKTIYSKKIVEELKLLMLKGVSSSFISKVTGIPVTTLYGWRDRSKKKKIAKGFNELKIVKEIKSIPIKTESKIGVSLGGDIKLAIPLELMGPMLKILKEEWYVSRI